MLIKNRINYIRFGQVYKSLKEYSTIQVTGNDSKEFLQKQLTNNIDNLVDNEFQHTSILDIKGRLVSTFYLLKENDFQFRLLVNKDFIVSSLERLNQFLISEDVEFTITKLHYYAVLGAIPSSLSGFKGVMFNERCSLTTDEPVDIEEISQNDFNLLKFSSGEPRLNVEAEVGDLFVNSFLVETSLSMKKGCYPGQETVSKILNNKGAAKYPVCLISKSNYTIKNVLVDDKKIGEIVNTVKVDDEFYYYALVNREYRVDQLKFHSGKIEFSVHYFPLIKNTIKDKAQDLFYDAVDEFQKNHNEVAIKMLKLAIEIDPDYEDAYESLGVIYGRIGDNYKAIELMEKLSKLNEKSVMAHTNLSLYYMKVGEIELAEEHKAQATIKQFEVLGDEAKAKRDKEQKDILVKEEQLRKKGMFKQVLEIDSEDALANFGMGEIEFSNMNYLDSEKYLEKAIKTDPKYSVAYLALSKTLLASNKKDKLKLTLNTGIKIATKNGDLMPANEMQRLLIENF